MGVKMLDKLVKILYCIIRVKTVVVCLINMYCVGGYVWYINGITNNVCSILTSRLIS